MLGKWFSQSERVKTSTFRSHRPPSLEVFRESNLQQIVQALSLAEVVTTEPICPRDHCEPSSTRMMGTWITYQNFSHQSQPRKGSWKHFFSKGHLPNQNTEPENLSGTSWKAGINNQYFFAVLTNQHLMKKENCLVLPSPCLKKKKRDKAWESRYL